MSSSSTRRRAGRRRVHAVGVAPEIATLLRFIAAGEELAAATRAVQRVTAGDPRFAWVTTDLVPFAAHLEEVAASMRRDLEGEPHRGR